MLHLALILRTKLISYKYAFFFLSNSSTAKTKPFKNIEALCLICPKVAGERRKKSETQDYLTWSNPPITSLVNGETLWRLPEKLRVKVSYYKNPQLSKKKTITVDCLFLE
jgi:hypothetical protein